MIDLRQGDCLEVMRTLPDNSVDMIFTDPPYGHNQNSGDLNDSIRRDNPWNDRDSSRAGSMAIANDGPEANDLFRAALPEFRRLLKPGCCCCCCCCGGGPDPQFARWSLWLDEVLEFKQMVVWDKGPIGMGWHYRRSYETVLVAMKPGAACKWYDTTNRIENIIRPIPKIIPQAGDHPTPKPVALARHFIELHTAPGDTVLDPFSGGGSTLAACAQIGRKAIGIELNPEYIELARQRINAETPSLFAGDAQ